MKLFNGQTRYVLAAIGLLFATILPGLLPTLVSAATVTERSVQLSNSSVSSTNVTYSVNFKSVEAAGAFVVDFCSDSPTIGQTCTAPTGFDVGTPTSATAGFTDVAERSDDANNNTIRVTGTIAADTLITVDIAGITNPSTAGPLYVRIVTFDNATNADLYTSTNPGTDAAVIDEGGVAVSITPTIGVAGSVLESLTFCVSGGAIGEDCAGVTAPVLTLGETVGDVTALVPGTVSTGTLNTQISTNAASGAVIRLKSDATDCGGLLRAGALTECDIQPALQTDVIGDQAEFGVKTATATATGGVTDASGTLQPVPASGYNNTTYALNYVDGNASGVTSVFGDPFLNTNNLPANNQNMQLTFGVSVTNDTPAGLYSADLSMIATGKF